MEWFQGSIVEAIQASKSQKAVFVVYIEGVDDASKTTSEVLNRPIVAEKLKSKEFVSIKLVKDSPGHKQFAEIYKMVPVPSVFFIGQNGLASEVVVGNNESANVEGRLLAAIQKCASEIKMEGSQAAAVPPSVPPAPTPEPSSSVNAGTAIPTPRESSVSPQPAAAPIDERVEKAKQLIAQKNEEKVKEEIEKDKTTERERRRVGQEIYKAKLSRQEQEMKEALEERKKDTLEDAAARKKILDQIAQDRKERLERERVRSSAAQAPTDQQAPSSSASPPPSDVNIARLQFRLPGGETKVHTFPAHTTLTQIRQFIDNNIVLPFNEYQIATTFPRREFTWRENELDLRTLHLLPSSVLLILPIPGTNSVVRSNGWAKMMVAFFWSLVTPLYGIRDYVSSLIWGGGSTNQTSGSTRNPRSSATGSSTATDSSTPSASQPPFGRTTIRKRGNIHTLADENDANKDDNNTWNGNSTQQM